MQGRDGESARDARAQAAHEDGKHTQGSERAARRMRAADDERVRAQYIAMPTSPCSAPNTSSITPAGVCGNMVLRWAMVSDFGAILPFNLSDGGVKRERDEG